MSLPKTTKKKAQAKPKTAKLHPVDELILLKKQANGIEARMKELKEELYKDMKPAETIKTENGTITLNSSNAWSLPLINVTSAQELLKERFTDYFKPKTTYGVEAITKALVSAREEGEPITEEAALLAKKLTELTEIKTTESWTIKPNE